MLRGRDLSNLLATYIHRHLYRILTMTGPATEANRHRKRCSVCKNPSIVSCSVLPLSGRCVHDHYALSLPSQGNVVLP